MRHGGSEQNDRVARLAEGSGQFGPILVGGGGGSALPRSGGQGGSVGGYVTEGDIKSELRDAIEPVTQALSSVQQYMDILARHKLSEASISDLAQAEACLERVRAELHVAHTRNLLQHAKDNVERFEKDLKSYE